MQSHNIKPGDNGRLSRRLNSLESLRDELLDLLVLVLQQTQRVCNIVPLPFILSPWQPGSELVRQLFSMLVLYSISIVFNKSTLVAA